LFLISGSSRFHASGADTAKQYRPKSEVNSQVLKSRGVRI